MCAGDDVSIVHNSRHVLRTDPDVCCSVPPAAWLVRAVAASDNDGITEENPSESGAVQLSAFPVAYFSL